MIVLLVSSTSLLARPGSDVSLTGGLDSIMVSYDDLRAANAKFVELEYEKKARRSLELVVANDSVIISTISEHNKVLREKIKKSDKKNTYLATGLGAAILALIISLIK